jgi:hypothetical protein
LALVKGIQRQNGGTRGRLGGAVLGSEWGRPGAVWLDALVLYVAQTVLWLTGVLVIGAV